MDLSDISIIKLLPPNLARDKNVRMMCEAFDEELRRVIAAIPGAAIVPNLVLKQITDNIVLDLLAWQFHCDFYSIDFPIERKQELVLKSLDWHTRKGTPSVVDEIVSTVFSRPEIQEWFEYGGLPYRFRIVTKENLPDAAVREKFIRAVSSVKNTRSYLDKIISLMYFEDKSTVTDYSAMVVRRKDFESFKKSNLKLNGRVKLDGHTVKPVEAVRTKLNGKWKLDGGINLTSLAWVPANSHVRIPIKLDQAGLGVLDKLNMKAKANLFDVHALSDSFRAGKRYSRKLNGNYRLDGTIKLNSGIYIPV